MTIPFGKQKFGKAILLAIATLLAIGLSWALINSRRSEKKTDDHLRQIASKEVVPKRVLSDVH